VSSYVLMKILESAPARYDRGIRLLSLGKLDQIYRELVAPIQPGDHVLDIGCGTGALGLRAAAKGAIVKGIDINSDMLAIAEKRKTHHDLAGELQLQEKGVAELDSEPTKGYDVVLSGLCFSELTPAEISATIKELRRVIKPDGWLLIADELLPSVFGKRLLHWLIKLPLSIVTYLLTQTGTRAIKDLPAKLERVGFVIIAVQCSRLNILCTIKARNRVNDSHASV